MDQGAQRPAKAPTCTQPMRTLIHQEQGVAMGWEKKERERVAGRWETRPASPPKWEREWGPPRPMEWRKTLGDIASKWEGESSCQGKPRPLE